MKHYLLLAIAFAMAGCGGNSASSNSSLLQGTWKNACVQIPTGSQIESVVGSGPSLTYQMTSFSDNTCTSGALSVSQRMTYAVGSTVSDSDSSIMAIDLVYQALTLNPISSDTVQYLNLVNFCGESDWSLGKATDISGKNCGGTVYGSVGQKVYSIFKVDGNQLYFDIHNRSSSTDMRPFALFSTSYTRQ